MCGIVGAVRISGGLGANRFPIRLMARSIHHRGPDDDGFHLEDNVALGMRRLSIIDVDGGQQPLSDESETLWLVCNGEIYNFRELRAELLQKGYRFKTESDCEVILNLYKEYGDAFTDHLNGMYGFALWDSKRQRLLLGRDRLGVKPLYYALHDGWLIFASEFKAILKVPGFSVSIDPVALEAYLSLGYTPAPMTLVEGIVKLPPASLLTVEGGKITVCRYWSLPQGVDEELDDHDWSSAVRESLERSVRAQMVADVPIGAFLSGGVDSSAVVAFMARQSSEPIRTYSIGFKGKGAESFYNELPYARQVAKQFGTEHKEILVTPDVVKLLPRLIWHMDEPIADSAIVTTFLVAEFAAKDVKVILSGVGGDELFGGYRRYLGEYYAGYYRQLPAWLRTNVLSKVATRLPSDRHSKLLNMSRLVRSFVLSADLSFEERYRRYVEIQSSSRLEDLLVDRPSKHYDALGEAFRESPANDRLQQLMSVDLLTQLPDDLLLLTDKMTMATSLECRVPLLDHELVELAARIPANRRIRGGRLKYMMKKALRGVLSDEILRRPKRGFGAPMGAWIKKQLEPVMRSLLSKDAIERRGMLHWRSVSEAVEEHRTNRADHTDHLLSLMNLEIWCRLFLDGETHEDIAQELSQGDQGGDSLRLPSLSVST